jgi:8-hydroxy-5-deazaflavin:NADPH oxidoreductase
MSIGITGAGALGSNLARLLAKSGISTTIANRRGPQSLKGLADELGPSLKAGTVPEAASADIVVVAVRWVDVQKALTGRPDWNRRIVIDGTNALVFLDPDSPDAKDPSNPLAAFGIKAIDLGGKHSSQIFRTLVPGARVVKAFNHLPVSVLPDPADRAGRESCSTRATMPTRRPRFVDFSNRPAISRSISVRSMWAGHLRHRRTARSRASTSSKSDRWPRCESIGRE